MIKKNKYSNLIVSLILILLCFYCFIDYLNGYLLFSYGPLQISQIYKGVLIISLASWIILSCNINNLFFPLLLLLFFLLGIMVRIITNNNDDLGIILISRILLFSLFLLFFIKVNNVNSKRYSKLININFYVLVSSIILGLFGVGLSTYGSLPLIESPGHGIKGFFVAGNELGALFIFFSVLYLVTNNNIFFSTLRRRLFLIFITFISILIGTKTAILGCIFIFSFIEFFLSPKKNIPLKLFISLIILFTIVYFYNDRLISLLSRQYYFFEKNNLFDFIYSGRISFIEDTLDFLLSRNEILIYFFGIDLNVLSQYVKGATEVDLIDIGVWLGIPTMFLILFMYVYMILYISALKRNSKIKLIIFTLVLLFFISLVAGHILTSGMLLPLMPLALFSAKLSTLENHNE